jgi:hypothetical protein
MQNPRLEAGTVDILICALAARRGWEVLSGDGGLNRCLAAKKFHVKQKRTAAMEEAKSRRTLRKS